MLSFDIDLVLDIMQYLLLVMLAVCFILTAEACGPGRGPMRRRGPRKILPLIYKQHDPNFSERSLAASGLPDGAISREDKMFRDLVPNYNPDIIFKDEEGTGADRLMTQRCKEKLNTLAISVMNQWPGVRVRVTEAWDEESHHAKDSLHYEGRAVDITTSDRDRAKYGLLASLAVEAGFDWVYYESRSHVHASCKAESAHPGQHSGCFPGQARVRTSLGVRKMQDLIPGDMVESVDSSGAITWSEVLMFLDRSEKKTRQFLTVRTEGGKNLTLTSTHLVYTGGKDCDKIACMEADYAGKLEVGQTVLVKEMEGLVARRVKSVEIVSHIGVFAPLTRAGNLVVDGVVASCYAVIDSQTIAHWAFGPVRWVSSLVEVTQTLWRTVSWGDRESTSRDSESLGEGVHWYPSLLYSIASVILPSHLLP